MKLYHSPTSPYVRKAMVILHLGGIAGRVELVAGGGTPLAPNAGTVSANPLGKVPCLITDAGEAIFDSRVICRYLDHVAGTGLYPADDSIWGVLTREALADGILDAGILAVYEKRLRPEEIRMPAWVEAQTVKMRRAIETLEHGFAALSGPVRADHIAIGCALGYVDFRFGDLGWRAGAPKLAAWYEAFAATPAMSETAPKE
ncbi:glutathione S-transferase [Limibaculum sp. M0105]|uniref:Glutathione S-transferase n=1 Tax=Thermohalobaculum xanthum TaxID=2753746 RepID=A0A8J7M6I4_9RHOB|nr:glutathione S-transferase [Thermohalobaculum xanthum]MBK0398625.1 glutathione S-transferase [Thermohalobaculum xanthum]